jgi:hypothetical protein
MYTSLLHDKVEASPQLREALLHHVPDPDAVEHRGPEKPPPLLAPDLQGYHLQKSRKSYTLAVEATRAFASLLPALLARVQKEADADERSQRSLARVQAAFDQELHEAHAKRPREVVDTVAFEQLADSPPTNGGKGAEEQWAGGRNMLSAPATAGSIGIVSQGDEFALALASRPVTAAAGAAALGQAEALARPGTGEAGRREKQVLEKATTITEAGSEEAAVGHTASTPLPGNNPFKSYLPGSFAFI